MILVDTSAWIGHLRSRDARLVRFLLERRVRTCDVVLGELLLGSGMPVPFRNDLLALPQLPSPNPKETRVFVERHSSTFAGSGVGWADVQIIHTALASGVRLYTADRYVRRTGKKVGVALA